MEESWEVCVAHMERITETIGGVIAEGAASGEFEVDRRAAGGDVRLHRDDTVLPSADDRAMRRQARGRRIDQMIDFVLAALAPRG